ncbi:hypothetical protein KSP40_PGU000838 [Platanthera guangdongensis]|uniref:Uncharacterized protein n=1 Tax=Platanthera guangdongensis TaxID=2320717 RepID=A0ABR2MSY5_9ASPA
MRRAEYTFSCSESFSMKCSTSVGAASSDHPKRLAKDPQIKDFVMARLWREWKHYVHDMRLARSCWPLLSTVLADPTSEDENKNFRETVF